MDAHEDPAYETVTAGNRAVLMAATVAAEQVARHWRHQAELAAGDTTADAGRWQERYAAQRRLAGVEVGAADQRWVDVVDVDQVARVWETAHAWAELEPDEFGPHADRIRDLVRDRYGVDLDDPDRAAARHELHEAVDREHVRGREDTDRANDDVASAVVLAGSGADRASDQAEDEVRVSRLAAGEHHDTAEALEGSAEDCASDYDSDARREQLVERAVTFGAEPEVAAGRARAANAQARPVREATTKSARPGLTRSPRRAPSRQRDTHRAR